MLAILFDEWKSPGCWNTICIYSWQSLSMTGRSWTKKQKPMSLQINHINKTCTKRMCWKWNSFIQVLSGHTNCIEAQLVTEYEKQLNQIFTSYSLSLLCHAILFHLFLLIIASLWPITKPSFSIFQTPNCQKFPGGSTPPNPPPGTPSLDPGWGLHPHTPPPFQGTQRAPLMFTILKIF